MADKKLDRLLAAAETAYARQDKRKGAKLVDQILRQNFNHAATWQLLFRLFGKGRGFDEFQRAFTLQYYPDQLHQLRKPEAAAAPEEPPAPKKPSFWKRLFRRNQQESETSPPVAAPDAAQSASRLPTAGEPRSTSPAAGIRQDPPAAPAAPARAASRPEAPGLAARIAASAPPARIIPATDTPAYSSFPTGPMSASRRAAALAGRDKIHVVVVDDITQTRETVIRTLRFQDNIEIVGTATNGLQALQLVREVLPDVVIMDVNMPDMDGITATDIIKREIPHAQIIILTVQDDVDYIRKAMMAGARDFLAKPPVIEELIAAVQRAADFAKQERERVPPPSAYRPESAAEALSRGKILTVYSARGGAGCTLLACNLAAALYNSDTRVVVVDGNLQFGDVEILFNVQSSHTILDLVPRVGELDRRLIDEVLVAHTSGIKLLLPSRPERSELVTGPQFSAILTFLSRYFDYVIIDAAHRLSDVTLAGLDTSDLVLLLTTQDIPSIARTRKFLDLLPAMELDSSRILIAMNQYREKTGIEPDKVGQAFHTKITNIIPHSIEVVIPSINRGVPFMLQREALNRPIGRAMLELVQTVRQRLVALEQLTTGKSG